MSKAIINSDFDSSSNDYMEPIRDPPSPHQSLLSRWTTLEPATPPHIPTLLGLPVTDDDDKDEIDLFQHMATENHTTHTIPTNVPQWFVLAYRSITTVDLGPTFHPIIVLYTDIEHIHGFENGGKRFSKEGRPSQLTKWISNGRWRTRAPNITDI
jgi:hypothetical protein